MIPDSICNLTTLKSLNLELRALESVIPPCIGQLSSLELLWIRSYDRTDLKAVLLPSSFWHLHSLKSLRLMDMKLVGLETPAIPGSFPDLEDISFLQSKKFVSDWSDIFLTSLKLKTIDLSISKVWFSNGALRNLRFLQSLYMSVTLSKWILGPDFWGSHPDLRQLSIYGEPFVTGSITPEIGQMRNLTNLAIASTNIKGTTPSSITNCPLQEVTIISTQISHPLPSNIGDLNATLLRLDISNLVGPPSTLPASLGALKRLNSLRLPLNNFFGTFPPGLENTALTTFFISNNNFTGPLPPIEASNLNYEASSNHFSGTIPRSLMKVRSLILSHNELEGELPLDFFDYAQFGKIDLSNNHLSGCLPPMKAYFTQQLDFSYNNFSCDLPSNYNWVNDLKLAQNKITGNLSTLFAASQFRCSSINLDNNLLSGSLPDLNHPLWSLRSLSRQQSLHRQSPQHCPCSNNPQLEWQQVY